MTQNGRFGCVLPWGRSCGVRVSVFSLCSVLPKQASSRAQCLFFTFFFENRRPHAGPRVSEKKNGLRPLGHERFWHQTRESKTTSSRIFEESSVFWHHITIPLCAQCVFSFCHFFENFDVSGLHTEHESVFSFWPKPVYAAGG